MVAFTGAELMDWVQDTTDGWRRLIAVHPEVLAFACDIRGVRSVAELLQHIVAVELRYTERLHELPETPYASIPYESGEAVFAVHDRAWDLLSQLTARDEIFWKTVVEMQTRSAGLLRASRRVVFSHLLTHSIRHYAQLATLVRKQGVAPDWPMDYILTAGRALTGAGRQATPEA